MNSTYFVYILECADSTLYTGISTDPMRRLSEHNAGTGAKYTRSRRPVRLVFKEEAGSKSDALKRELQIKKLSRMQKIRLINDTQHG